MDTAKSLWGARNEDEGRSKKSSSLRNGWQNQGCVRWRKAKTKGNIYLQIPKGLSNRSLLMGPSGAMDGDCKGMDDGSYRKGLITLRLTEMAALGGLELPEGVQEILSARQQSLSALTVLCCNWRIKDTCNPTIFCASTLLDSTFQVYSFSCRHSCPNVKIFKHE